LFICFLLINISFLDLRGTAVAAMDAISLW